MEIVWIRDEIVDLMSEYAYDLEDYEDRSLVEKAIALMNQIKEC